MRLLVLHGSSGNFGDTAMLEGVVRNLLRNLPSAELFVADRAGLRTHVWDLKRVHRLRVPDLVFPGEHALANLRYLWRYAAQWRRTVRRRWFPLALGEIASTRAIHLRGVESGDGTDTLDEFCAPFDALHMVGGGYLNDTFPDVLVQFACIVEGFVEQGKPVVLTGQQVGPFQSRVLERLAGRVLRSARFVGLREPTRSVEVCRALHLDPRCFCVMGDDSFGLPCADESEVSACLAAHNLEPGKFLAFNLRVAPYAAGHGDYVDVIAQIAERLAKVFGMAVVMVPIAFNDADCDDRAGEELLQQMRNTRASRVESARLNPELVRGLLGKAFGAVGVSYHFSTFALCQGVPAVCLYDGDYYAQKARGVCAFWQDDRLAISLSEADVSLAVAQISGLLQDVSSREQLSRVARSAIGDWRRLFDDAVQKSFMSAGSPKPAILAERSSP